MIIGNPYENVIIGREGRVVLKVQGGPTPSSSTGLRVRTTWTGCWISAPGEDALWTKAGLFGMRAGEVTTEMLHFGAVAAEDRVLYDPKTGAVRIDPDETGSAKA